MVTAVRQNNLEDALQLLLARRADMCDKDREGRTYMSIAKAYGHMELYKILLMCLPSYSRTAEQWADLEKLRGGSVRLYEQNVQPLLPMSSQFEPITKIPLVEQTSKFSEGSFTSVVKQLPREVEVLARANVTPTSYPLPTVPHPDAVAKYRAVMEQIDMISEQLTSLDLLQDSIDADSYKKRREQLKKTMSELSDEAAAFCAGMDEQTLMSMTINASIAQSTSGTKRPTTPPLRPPPPPMPVEVHD